MTVPPCIPCSICELPVTVGDKIVMTCVGFDDDGEAIVNTVHFQCIDHETANLRRAIEVRDGG